MSDTAPPPPPIPSAPDATFLSDPAAPRWIKDVFRFLPVKSQFVLSGNIRDRYPFPLPEGKYLPLSLTQYLAETLKLKGYQHFISFNSTAGFSAVTPRGEDDAAARDFFKTRFKITFDDAGRFKCSLDRSLELIAAMVTCKEQYLAIFADFASRYLVRLDSPSEKEHEYFTRALVLSHEATAHTTPACNQAQFNPVFWVCDKENDLPHWLTLENPRIRSVVVPKPDHILRHALIVALTPALEGAATATAQQTQEKPPRLC